METLRGAALNWAALSKLERGERMTLSKTKKKTLKQRILHFFWKFDMCQCVEPKYEVLNGVLSCSICSKATKWEGQPK